MNRSWNTDKRQERKKGLVLTLTLLMWIVVMEGLGRIHNRIAFDLSLTLAGGLIVFCVMMFGAYYQRYPEARSKMRVIGAVALGLLVLFIVAPIVMAFH